MRALQIEAEVAADAGDMEALERIKQEAKLGTTSDDPECRAIAMLTKGFCHLVGGELELATAAFAETEPRLHDLSLQAEHRRALNGLGMSLTALGKSDEAAEAMIEALSVARRLGDTVACCNTLGNLASLYQDLGWFEDAARCYRQALGRSDPLTVRVSAEVNADAARLAMTLGSWNEAFEFAEACEAAAKRSGLWRHIALARLTKADLHIAGGTEELAWPLVEDAVALAEGRSHLLADLAQYVRLRKHFAWRTQGSESKGTPTPSSSSAGYPRMTDRLEIAAFEEWLKRKTGQETAPSSPALTALVRTGYCGIVARLLALGVSLPGLPPKTPDEPSAILVARMFPHERRMQVPSAVADSPLIDVR
jgi:ATP/maltotriose-dependent transcriptional regulator MalT